MSYDDERDRMEEEIENSYDCCLDDDDYDDYDYRSAAGGDYSPSCPWNAPGMSIRDFI